MKICYFNNSYFPYNIGGAETVLKVLAENVSFTNGFEVVVITAFRGNAEEYINGVLVRRVKLRNPYWSIDGPRNNYEWFHFHLNTIGNLLNKQILMEIIKNESPDLIHTHNIADFSPVIWSVAKQLAIPVIHTLHDYRLLCEKGQFFRRNKICRNRCWSCRLLSFPRKSLSQNVHTVIGVSRFVLDMHKEYGFFHDSRKIVINNGIESTQHFQTKGKSSNSKIFGYFGRITEYKGVFKLVKDLVHLLRSEELLLIAGAGKEDDVIRLRKMINGENRIHYLGYLTKEDFYAKIDCLFLPSLWYEPFPTVILEAFNHGIPVIANNVGGISELIKNGRNGYLVNFNDYAVLSKVLQAIRTTDKMEQMIKNCFMDCKKYNRSKFISKHIELYRGFN